MSKLRLAFVISEITGTENNGLRIVAQASTPAPDIIPGDPVAVAEHPSDIHPRHQFNPAAPQVQLPSDSSARNPNPRGAVGMSGFGNRAPAPSGPQPYAYPQVLGASGRIEINIAGLPGGAPFLPAGSLSRGSSIFIDLVGNQSPVLDAMVADGAKAAREGKPLPDGSNEHHRRGHAEELARRTKAEPARTDAARTDAPKTATKPLSSAADYDRGVALAKSSRPLADDASAETRRGYDETVAEAAKSV